MVKMDERISQLMDGELDDEESRRLLASLRQPETQHEWHAYHLIGDVMRDTSPVSGGFMERFNARLAEEPTVLAPQRLPRRHPRTIALSAAASFAAVGLVVWAVMQTGAGGVNSPVELIVAKSPSPGLVSASVNPYLLAHQEHSPSVAMQGMATYIRTVSESREVAAR